MSTYGDNSTDVRDFGADGDGTTDNTIAIQSALDAGGVTFFPPGIYVTRQLIVPSGAVLCGVNAGSFDMPDLPSSQLSILKLMDGTDDHLLYGPQETQSVIIEDLQLDGNKFNQSSPCAGIYIEDAPAPPPPPYVHEARWILNRVYIHHFKLDGLYIGLNRRSNRVKNCVLVSNNQHGIRVLGTDSIIESCDVGLNGSNGIVIGGCLTRINNCNIFWNQHGINVIQTMFGVVISGNGIDRNYQAGVNVEQNAREIVVSENVFCSNSQAQDDLHPHVKIDDDASAVVGSNAFARSVLANQPSYAVELGSGAFVSALDTNIMASDSTTRGLTNAKRMNGYSG